VFVAGGAGAVLGWGGTGSAVAGGSGGAGGVWIGARGVGGFAGTRGAAGGVAGIAGGMFWSGAVEAGQGTVLAALWELSGAAGVVAAWSAGFVPAEGRRPALGELDEFPGAAAWFKGTQGSGPGAFCCGQAAGGAGVCAMGVWVAIVAVAMAKAPAVIVRVMFTEVLLCDRSVRVTASRVPRHQALL
jgi:hypothetical protein